MNTKLTFNQRRFAAWAGMIAPALFVATFIIEGWLRPGYNSIAMYVSELSIGPYGWIQILNFIILGILFLIFARGIASEFNEGKASRFGPSLLTIIGLSFLVSGPFVTDPGSIFLQMSWHGMVHGIFGAIVFSLAPISCFVFFRRFREDSKWKSLAWWTFIVGCVVVVSVVLMKAGELPPSIFTPWEGLIQRVALISYLTWIFSFAFVFYKQIKLRKSK